MKCNRIAVTVIVLLLASVLATSAGADCRHRPAAVFFKEKAAVVVAPVIATLVGVPLYQVSAPPYVPAVPYGYPQPQAYPHAGQQNASGVDPSVNSRLDRLEDALSKLIEQLNAGGVPGGNAGQRVQPMQPADVPGGAGKQQQPRGAVPQGNSPGLVVLQQQCASCHSRTTASAMGGGFTLLEPNGQLTRLTDKGRAEVLFRTYGHDEAKRMPKGKPPMSNEDYEAVVKLLDSVR